MTINNDESDNILNNARQDARDIISGEQQSLQIQQMDFSAD